MGKSKTHFIYGKRTSFMEKDVYFKDTKYSKILDRVLNTPVMKTSISYVSRFLAKLTF